MKPPQVAPSPLVAELAARIYQLAATETSRVALLERAAAEIVRTLECEFVAVMEATKGRWKALAAAGRERQVPHDLLSQALDEEQPALRGDWCAFPLRSGEVLVAARSRDATNLASQLGALAGALVTGMQATRAREHDKQQIARLSALVEISADWNQTLEMATLLTRMAEASTKLLRAERASIFLWDKTTRTLVGRPALGVEGGELRIPDDAGIVGQVVRSGEPRRVDADIASEQQAIDRRTDQRLKFQTRSLLCVPLRGKGGELFGAFEVINKIGGDFTSEDEQTLVEFASHAALALENSQQWEELLAARRQIADAAEQGVRLIGECPPIQALRSTVTRVADTDLAVLILGENGTGKEVVAQMIHYRSRRRHEPLVAVNCAAITETLLESELFGHEKGAFTDAREMRRGKFELAAGGTIFLDEIGDMSLAGQAKLLRVLEEKVIVRVGGSTPIATKARVLAATNQDLAELVRARRFREDLYFRLNVVTLELPPLRQRGDDVVLLAETFLKRFSAQARRRAPKFTSAAKKRLLSHSWPGNVRELRNLMERLAYLAPENQDKIDAPDLAFILSPGDGTSRVLSLDAPLADATRDFQIEYIRRHIDAARGNMTAAAEKLGLHRSNLYRKMRQLGMDTGESSST